MAFTARCYAGRAIAASARIMPTEARGNYLPEAPRPLLRETKTHINCGCKDLYLRARCSFNFIHLSCTRWRKYL